ncbi:MAG: flagellar basal body rod protein FlgC [Stellaceae bacterium]
MSLFSVFSISGSGMSAESQRLTAVASNLANANSVANSSGQPYRAREVVFRAVSPDGGGGGGAADTGMAGVEVAGVVTSPAPLRRTYDPSNPFADAHGYVAMPNVNPIDEIVNMISAQRDYQADLDAFNVAKTLMMKTLSI